MLAHALTHGRAQRGVSFPLALFRDDPAACGARFDAAYDLSCRLLGMHSVEVLEEGERLRFLPSHLAIG